MLTFGNQLGLIWCFGLSQVYDLSAWALFAIESKGGVGNTLCLETTDGDGAPGTALAHSDL